MLDTWGASPRCPTLVHGEVAAIWAPVRDYRRGVAADWPNSFKGRRGEILKARVDKG